MKTRLMLRAEPQVIKEDRIQLILSTGEGEITYVTQKEMNSGTYYDAGREILRQGLSVPTGEDIAPLVHSIYYPQRHKKYAFRKIKSELELNDEGFWVYQINLWTPKGVYVVHDNHVEGMSKKLEIYDLEEKLKNGKELSWGGIRFSTDGKVRFAPKQSYRLEGEEGEDCSESPIIYEDHTPETFVKDGFIIASYNETGAE